MERINGLHSETLPGTNITASPAKSWPKTLDLPAARPHRVVLTTVAAVSVLVLDALTPLGLAIWLLQVILVWAATLWADRHEMLKVAAVCSTCIVLAFLLSVRVGPVTWIDRSNLFLSLAAVGALTHSCMARIAANDARLKAARELGQMVLMVSQLLPMCAWCKKIRNEAGAWEQLETYFHKHSQMEFTHGLCQQCAVRFDG